QRRHVPGRPPPAALRRGGRLRRLAAAAAGRHAWADLHLAGARPLPGLVCGVDAHGRAVHPLPLRVAGPEAPGADGGGRAAPPGGALRRTIDQADWAVGAPSEGEAAPRPSLGFLYLLGVPLAAGLATVEGVGIAGFNYTGLMWLFFLVSG